MGEYIEGVGVCKDVFQKFFNFVKYADKSDKKKPLTRLPPCKIKALRVSMDENLYT